MKWHKCSWKKNKTSLNFINSYAKIYMSIYILYQVFLEASIFAFFMEIVNFEKNYMRNIIQNMFMGLGTNTIVMAF